MITVDEKQEKLLLDLKNYAPETYYHCLRVKRLTYKLLNKASSKGHVDCTSWMINIVCKGAMFHDVGKMNTNNKILTSEGVLSSDEKDVIKNHTSIGAEMVNGFLAEDEREIIKEICLKHHERVDGNGYFKYTDIPPYIQIISICDVYDALTSDRVYRKGFSQEKAIKMIENHECGLFNAWLIDCLKEVII